MDYNDEFKEINSEEKAYFLGFMYADGCLSKIKRPNSTYIKHQVQISLTDKQIIDDFKSLFPFFNLQVFDFGKYKSNWSKQYALRKANKVLYQDLLNLGMFERKSNQNLNKLNVPDIDEKLIKHFIRGYFDGDGSISISKKRPNLRRIEICCSSESFLLQIKKLLEEAGISCPIFRTKNNNKSPLYVIEWVNSNDVISLRKFFYEDCNIYLKRKREVFDSFEIIDKKYMNPRCPYCKGLAQKHNRRQMKYGMSQRYKCTECSKGFSIRAQVKQGELLEKPEEVNQQPSLNSNVLEGSTTNSRVLTSNVEDSNADTSALPGIDGKSFSIKLKEDYFR